MHENKRKKANTLQREKSTYPYFDETILGTTEQQVWLALIPAETIHSSCVLSVDADCVYVE